MANFSKSALMLIGAAAFPATSLAQTTACSIQLSAAEYKKCSDAIYLQKLKDERDRLDQEIAGLTNSVTSAISTATPQAQPGAQQPPIDIPKPVVVDNKEQKTPSTDPKKVTDNGSDGTGPNLDDPFKGLGFGLGLALTYDLGSNDRVADAELVNGIVRVTDQENVTGRLLLESHYFFTPESKFLGTKSGDWGWGPFVAVEAGSDPIVEAIGAGLMIGFRRGGSSEASGDDKNGTEKNETIVRTNKKSESFNLGFGVIFDFDSKILGEGIIANQPLPMGEETIRFREKEQFGLLFMSSYSF